MIELTFRLRRLPPPSREEFQRAPLGVAEEHAVV